MEQIEAETNRPLEVRVLFRLSLSVPVNVTILYVGNNVRSSFVIVIMVFVVWAIMLMPNGSFNGGVGGSGVDFIL